MNFLKAFSFKILASLLIIFNGFVSGSRDSLYNNGQMNRVFGSGGIKHQDQPTPPSTDLNIHRDAANINEEDRNGHGNNEQIDLESTMLGLLNSFGSFGAKVVTPGINSNSSLRNYGSIDDGEKAIPTIANAEFFGRPAKSFQSFGDEAMGPDDVPNKLPGKYSRDGSVANASNVPTRKADLNDRGVPLNLSNPGRPCHSPPNQPFEDDKGGNYSPTSPDPANPPVVLGRSIVVLPLVKISDLPGNPGLKRKILTDNLRSSKKKLRQRHLTKENSNFRIGTIISTYSTNASTARSYWGRIGQLGIYIRATKTGVSIFEMKANFEAPRSFASKSMLNFSKAKETFRNASWSVHIGKSHASSTPILVKSVDNNPDPSSPFQKLMDIWIIHIDEEPYQMDLANSIATEQIVNLREGTLIVVIPAELGQKMDMKKMKGKGYDEILASFNQLLKEDFDQLAFIAKV